ncbi:hypothetical protein [Leptospira yasudae]|uniref:hypothetical protein n=1 Tax=Leptospira yasudae TaxID=2202201 RepID=UPI001090B3FC|nr:hypothetical protein [Leptospira yasudae]TGM98034.1 hypothetical protein EHR10_11200 [Leptospira yasudae]
MKIRWKSLNERLTGITLLTSLLAGIVGGVFSLNEYLEGIKAEKIKSTLDYVSNYSSGEVAASNQRLFTMWERNYPDLESVLDANIKDERKLDAVYKLTSLSIIKSNHAGKDIDVLMNFYTSLVHCVQRKICDESSAKTFFHSDMNRFIKLHSAYIDYLRERWDKDIGMEIENYLTLTKKVN